MKAQELNGISLDLGIDSRYMFKAISLLEDNLLPQIVEKDNWIYTYTKLLRNQSILIMEISDELNCLLEQEKEKEKDSITK